MSGRGKKAGEEDVPKPKSSVSQSSWAGIIFPVSRIHRLLSKGQYAEWVGAGAAVYLSAVLEYLCAEMRELSGNASHDNGHCITPCHILLGMKND